MECLKQVRCDSYSFLQPGKKNVQNMKSAVLVLVAGLVACVYSGVIVPQIKPTGPLTPLMFGAKSANGSKGNGFPWHMPGTALHCTPDNSCQCNEMENECGNSVGGNGWLCNWRTIDDRYAEVGIPEQFSFIQWCDCCGSHKATNY